MSASLSQQHSLARRLVRVFCAFLVVAYGIQIASPLRLNFDAGRLLTMAVSQHHGHGYLVEGKVDQFPVGYPFVVRALLKTGFASSSTLCLLNLVFLAIGLWVLRAWCHWTANSTELAVTLVLSSWLTVKSAAIPLSELLYFAVSSLAVYFACLFSSQSGTTKWWSFLCCFILSIAALQCRSVGLALFPAVFLTVILHADHLFARVYIRSRAKRVAVMTLCGVVPALVALFLLVQRMDWYATQFSMKQSYFQSLLTEMGQFGIIGFIYKNVCFRLSEFGQLFLNAPQSKLLWLSPAFYVSGGLLWIIALRGAKSLVNNRNMLPVALYFISYSALMIAWPYYDTRFWLPMLSVLVILCFSSIREITPDSRIRKYMIPAWILCYFALGIVAVGYTTRITLSGKNFSEVYADGNLKMTYRFAFENGLPVEMSKVQCRHLRLLRVFEPLAGGGDRLNTSDAAGEIGGHLQGDPCD